MNKLRTIKQTKPQECQMTLTNVFFQALMFMTHFVGNYAMMQFRLSSLQPEIQHSIAGCVAYSMPYVELSQSLTFSSFSYQLKSMYSSAHCHFWYSLIVFIRHPKFYSKFMYLECIKFDSLCISLTLECIKCVLKRLIFFNFGDPSFSWGFSIPPRPPGRQAPRH